MSRGGDRAALDWIPARDPDLVRLIGLERGSAPAFLPSPQGSKFHASSIKRLYASGGFAPGRCFPALWGFATRRGEKGTQLPTGHILWHFWHERGKKHLRGSRVVSYSSHVVAHERVLPGRQP